MLPRMAVCDICRLSPSDGRHQMTYEQSRDLPWDWCPKCSGGQEYRHVRCVSATPYHYECGCGISWSHPIGWTRPA